MTQKQWADIRDRALWTFVQTTAATVPAGLAVTDWASVRIVAGSAAVGAVAALLSAVKGMVALRRPPDSL